LGLEEGSGLALLVRDAKGDLAAVGVAARALEREEGVDLIVALASSVALAAKRSTEHVPIVFVTGSDPVAVGLVDAITRPGGRVTGLHSITTDLTAKRLGFLRELMPTVQRAVTFYTPSNAAAQLAMKLARDAAQHVGIELVERTVTSPEEIQERLRALSASDAEVFFFGSDAMVNSQGNLILRRTNALRMAVVAYGLDLVRDGALMGYGFSYRDLGRRSAFYVSRILAGANPKDLPVEAFNVPALAINLKAAKALGTEISPLLLTRVDELIE